MNIGEKIKSRRKELGISADKIAEKLKISRATIYRYENGAIEKLPSDILIPLSEILKLSPADLLDFEDSNHYPQTTDELSNHELEMLALFREANPEMQKAMIATLEASVNAKIAQNQSAKDK